ncbi:MAG: hypothetical protein ACTSUF_03655 [Candidatus Heimdallarchaeaceae archaeon]
MSWSEILNEIKKIKNSNPEPETNPEKKELNQEEPTIPEKHWWQISDWFTRRDELLEAILKQLQAMGQIQLAPAAPTPPPPVMPPGIEPKLDVIATEQTRTKELLEGFNFITNQSTVPTPGTPTEVISTVKTYLVIIRAHTTNTGNIYVGGQGVTPATGFILGAGESLAIPIDNLKKRIWIDADVAGEGVSWIALVD